MQKIRFIVYDFDKFSSDEVIGTLELSLGNLMAKREAKKVIETKLISPKGETNVGSIKV